MSVLKKYLAIVFVAVFLCALISPAFSEGDLQVVDAPLSEEFLNYSTAKNSDEGDPPILGDTGSESMYEGGYVPSPIDRSHLKDNPPQKNRDSGGNVGDTTIPTTYDLRSVNSTSYLPAVRNQGSYGTCWAHAAVGGMESNYLMKNLSGMAMDTDGQPNLSELHMSWFVYEDPKAGHSFSLRDGDFSGGPVFGQGGNADKSVAYMSRLAGPVLEADLPYSSIDKTIDGMNTVTGGKYPESYDLALRLHDAYQLGDMTTTLRETVKELIMSNGAVQVNYYSQQTVASSSSSTGDSTTSPYYRKNDSSPFSYYYSSDKSPNHAVLIVGWNDDFSVDNFNSQTGTPKSAGAWLVRNSWGNTWGDSGYFWMSYEQNITSVTAYAADVVPDGTTVYYHDALGHVGDFGYTSDSANIPGWAANVFKAEGENQLLSEVSFFTTENNAPYEIYVFKLGAEKPSTFSVNAESSATKKTGDATYAGYHVVALDDKIAIDDGEYFAVVVNTKNTGSSNIAVERAMNYSDSAGGGYYANPVINAGESYFAGSNSFPSSWTDGSTIDSPRNACIKAFTVHVVQINATLFPDETFRTYVATFDTDNDGYLSDAEIAAVTSITFTDTQSSITDLTGIKYFTALTALDVSKLTSLATLDVSDLPKLASLILGTNDVIELLKVTGTALTTLDVSNCVKLNLSNITRDSTLTVSGLTPEFKAASLLLSGQIGVNFYVYFPESVTATGTSTAFSIRGKTPHAPQPYDATFTKDVDGTTCYGFTCRINSAQMADPITATLTFGDNQTLTMDYSAKDYLALGLASGGDEVTQNLYKAIWNYGHYVQPMLATANNWTIGDKYLAMPALDDATLDVDAVKTAMSNYVSSITSSDSNFATLSISLMLESETTINIYLKPKNALSDTVYATFDDGTKYAVSQLQEGTHAGEYLIESNSIPAHKLGESHTLKIEAGSSWIQIEKLSAMSYVRTSLNSDSTSDDDKNACAALYDYFKATEAYRTQQDSTGQ